MGPRLLRWIFNTLMAILSRREIEGLENLPPEGPYIIAVNHLSVLDVPLAYSMLGGPQVTGWAAEKWRYHPIYGLLLRMGHGIFIERGKVDRRALRAAIEWLRAGNIFAMAPEGTRSRTGSMQQAKTGIAYLAHLTGAPIVPIAIIGTDRGIRTMLRLRRPKLTLRIGKPFRLPPLDRKDRAASLRRNTDEVMCRIAALLPPQHRGIYAEHPRLKELLAEQEGTPS
jgi:1-acyl-sn-glycerol-3-phosphate acyltransferase